MITAVGKETHSVYAGGGETTDYVDVKWFSKKFNKTARYSPATGILEVISKIHESMLDLNGSAYKGTFE